MNRAKLKKALKNRETIFGGWISYDHPSIAETFALTGFDFISIDMEHAPISLASAQRIISISQSKGVPCLPRPVSHSNDHFKPLLDSGADGLIVQMVESVDEVGMISNYLKYPPLGRRTFGINRAQDFGLNFDNYVSSWNDESILIIQIESKKGLENIDQITKHKSIDGIMIGPYDLSGSLGLPGEINHPTVENACLKIIEACKENNVSCGTQISIPTKENINDAINKGYSFIILGSDLFVLSEWSRTMSKTIRILKNEK